MGKNPNPDLHLQSGILVPSAVLHQQVVAMTTVVLICLSLVHGDVDSCNWTVETFLEPPPPIPLSQFTRILSL
jgi:hypothetical protein